MVTFISKCLHLVWDLNEVLKCRLGWVSSRDAYRAVPQCEQLLLAHVLGLWVCVWTAEHPVLLVGSPHLHETAVNSPKSTGTNKLGLVSICFLHCWPSPLEAFVNSFIPSRKWSFSLIALIPRFRENLWSAWHQSCKEQWWRLNAAACLPFISLLSPKRAHKERHAFKENSYSRHP